MFLYTEVVKELRANTREQYLALLNICGLEYEAVAEETVLIRDGGRLVATGARQEHILKYIAIDPAYQGEGLAATLVTALKESALKAGHKHLFLFTKPKNKFQFQSLFFYPVAQTGDVLLMEDRRDGIGSFLKLLPRPCTEGRIGSAVMNCNPFTLGHRYLIETAAKGCDVTDEGDEHEQEAADNGSGDAVLVQNLDLALQVEADQQQNGSHGSGHDGVSLKSQDAFEHFDGHEFSSLIFLFWGRWDAFASLFPFFSPW